MKDTLLRSFLALALALSVPAQTTLALGAGSDTALEQCHDGQPGHGLVAKLTCDACCAPPIASPTHPVTHFPVQEPQRTVSGLPSSGDLPDGPDRPPQGS